MNNNFSTFNMSQFGTDPNISTFTGLSGTDAEGRQLSLADAGASESSNDGIFGTVEFDSSWIGDGMDWQTQADIFSATKGVSDNLGPAQGMGEPWTRNMNLGGNGW
ncbi:hypothetical protein NQ176_g8402 [Zarea fungicola]|uniref:Uncharacterized protein n=1 Tax=Zarea fungicola TaxID=93591 RepID=A0ACC1MUP1_9HYPO|nr:hypothetical protein NQ176_g8402 [Lecanicillium fungicola]